MDLGALGRRRILVFKNQNKQNDKSPDHYLVVPTEGDDEDNIQAGVLWNQEKGENKEEKQKDVTGSNAQLY